MAFNVETDQISKSNKLKAGYTAENKYELNPHNIQPCPATWPTELVFFFLKMDLHEYRMFIKYFLVVSKWKYVPTVLMRIKREPTWASSIYVLVYRSWGQNHPNADVCKD